jgi:hypothetical protein
VQVLVSFENQHSTYYATAGYPAITVPLGLRTNGGLAALLGVRADGVPAGLTFIGKPGQDARLLAYAYAFEQASRAARRAKAALSKTAACRCGARAGRAGLAACPSCGPLLADPGACRAANTSPVNRPTGPCKPGWSN